MIKSGKLPRSNRQRSSGVSFSEVSKLGRALPGVVESTEETVAIRARSRADYQGSDDRGGTRFAELMPT
jgi:hypothetical protein